MYNILFSIEKAYTKYCLVVYHNHFSLRLMGGPNKKCRMINFSLLASQSASICVSANAPKIVSFIIKKKLKNGETQNIIARTLKKGFCCDLMYLLLY